MRMVRDRGVPMQMCGNNLLVLKAAPPVGTSREMLDEFVAGIASVIDLMHTSGSFWTEVLGMARRVVNI